MSKSTPYGHYSVGVVAEDAGIEAKGYVKIYPKEKLPNHEGELLDKKDLKGKFSHPNGTMDVAIVNATVTIIARWKKPNGSMRVSAPNVKRGETVRIFKAYDTDQYYWEETEMENDIRKQESVLFMVSNEPEFGVPTGEKNSYYFVVDTVNKMIRLKTNNNHGEATAYDVSFNTKTGVFKILDSQKNSIVLDSPKKRLTINVPTVEINAKESFTVNTKNSTVNASSGSNIKTKSFNLDSSSGTVKGAFTFKDFVKLLGGHV